MSRDERSEQQLKEQVRAHFGATAQDYVESTRHRTGRDLQRLVELAECGPEDDALDIATGGGHTALALAPHIRHIVASDLTPEMLAAAERFIREQGIENASFEIAEAEHLPFADASFDIVSCRIAPHHFADVHAFCREVARVLRPGGRFVLIDSWSAEDDELDAFINEIEWRRDNSHARSYRISEWQQMIGEAGLEVDVVEPFERTHEFDEWVTRTRMIPEDRAGLEAYIRDASPRVHEFFSIVTTDDGGIESYTDHKVLLRARKRQ